MRERCSTLESLPPVVITPPTSVTSCDEIGIATNGQLQCPPLRIGEDAPAHGAHHDDTRAEGCAAGSAVIVADTNAADDCSLCGRADTDDETGATLDSARTAADTTSKSNGHEVCGARGLASPAAADAVSTTNSHGHHAHGHNTNGHSHVGDHTHGSTHNHECDDVVDDPNEAALIGLEGTVFARALVGALTHAGGSGSALPAAVEGRLEFDATADSKSTRKRNQAVLIIAFVSFFCSQWQKFSGESLATHSHSHRMHRLCSSTR
jgi:hypothetical protein